MKVLLLSHNPLGGSNNMGKTLRGLLAGVEREALCSAMACKMLCLIHHTA